MRWGTRPAEAELMGEKRKENIEVRDRCQEWVTEVHKTHKVVHDARLSLAAKAPPPSPYTPPTQPAPAWLQYCTEAPGQGFPPNAGQGLVHVRDWVPLHRDEHGPHADQPPSTGAWVEGRVMPAPPSEGEVKRGLELGQVTSSRYRTG